MTKPTRKFLVCAFMAAVLAPAAFGDAMLSVYVEQVRSLGGIGFYGYLPPPTDPTMIRNLSGTIGQPWTRPGETEPITFRAEYRDIGYADPVRVNRDREMYCPAGGSCAVLSPQIDFSVAGASGYADASRLALGVFGNVHSLHNGATSDAVAKVSNSFIVEADPQSGLQAGDEVTLRWNYHLDGLTSVGLDDPGWLWSDLSAIASFTRETTNCNPGDGGEAPPTCTESLAGLQFETDADVALSGGEDGYAGIDAFWSVTQGETSWWGERDRNVGPIPDPWLSSLWDTNNLTAQLDTGTGAEEISLGSLIFTARVGEQVRFDAELTSHMGIGEPNPANYASGYGSNSFFSTFDGFVTVETAGASLNWEVPIESATVPEPATTLMVGGALMLIAMGSIRARRIHT